MRFQMKKATAIFLLLAGCLLWSCIGISSRALYAAGLTPLQVSAVKSGTVAIALGLFLLVTDRSKLRVKKGDIILITILGATKFISDTLIFVGQSTIPLSLTVMLQVTYPYYVVLFSIPVFGEHLTRRKVACMAIAAFGCVLATGVLTESGPFEVIGIAAAASAGAVIGINNVSTKMSLNRGYDPETVLFYMFFAGAVISLFVADPISVIGTAASDLSLLGHMLLLGLVFTMLGHLLNLRAMKDMSVSVVSMICLSEIIFTALVGFFAFGENMTVSGIIGMFLIIASIVILNTGSSES